MATETNALQQQVTRELTEEARVDIDNLRAVQYAARLMWQSGCFNDIKDATPETSIAKAVVKIAIGRDFGFSAAESMQHIELIQGRPSIAAHARAAKMKAAGYSWTFRKFDSTVCDLVVFGPDKAELGDSVFTMEDATRMGLSGKDNWKKNPRNMLYCRAISNAQRWYAPEVLSASLPSREEEIDEAPKPERELATITLDSLTPSADENRGHDHTQPPTIGEVREASKAVSKDRAAAEQPKLIPSHVKAIQKQLDSMPKEMFWKVMGAAGFPSIEEVPADEAQTLIAVLKDAVEEARGAAV